MLLDEFLAQLARRLRIPDADVVTGDEIRDWPDGKLEELLAEGILQEIEPGTTVICDQCEEGCSIEPQLRTDPQTGRTVGVHVCLREGAGGRIEINLDRLRRWRINKRGLSKLGYISERQGAPAKPTRQMTRENESFLLRTALLQHHGLGGGTINWEPATQKILQGLTKLNQPKIHRTMKGLFGEKPMQAYKQRCKEQTLKGFLIKRDDGRHDVEAYAPSPDE